PLAPHALHRIPPQLREGSDAHRRTIGARRAGGQSARHGSPRSGGGWYTMAPRSDVKRPAAHPATLFEERDPMAKARSTRKKSKKAAKKKVVKKKSAARRPRPAAKPARKAPPRKVAAAKAAPPSRIGVITHTELASADPSATRAWCERVLGWKFGEAMPTPSGPYHMWQFAICTV